MTMRPDSYDPTEAAQTQNDLEHRVPKRPIDERLAEESLS